MEIENVQSFLNDLQEISKKHKIIIGCDWNGNFLEDLKGNNTYYVSYNIKNKFTSNLNTHTEIANKDCITISSKG